MVSLVLFGSVLFLSFYLFLVIFNPKVRFEKLTQIVTPSLTLGAENFEFVPTDHLSIDTAIV